jgi:hypothetical protein
MDAFRRCLRTPTLLLTIALAASACSSAGPAEERAGDPPSIDRRADGTVEPLARVLAASDRALEADSMHLTFEMVVDGPGGELRGSGEADVAFGGEPRQHMTFRYESFPGMPDGLEMEMIIVGPVVYMRMPRLHELGVSPTAWISMDLSRSVPGYEDLMEMGAGRNDPSDMLGYLQGAEHAEEVGTEIVNGVETTRYRVSVDLVDALTELPVDMRRDVEQATAQFRRRFGTTTMPFEIWVDGDGLLRRLTFRMEATGGDAGRFSMEMTIDVTGYGDDFELEIPPEDDVTDVTELAARAA